MALFSGKVMIQEQETTLLFSTEMELKVSIAI